MTLNYKPSIVSSVQGSVEALNAVFLVLNKENPLVSDILEQNYSQDIVDKFLTASEAVVQNLQAASLTASGWLKETGDSISRNLAEAGQVQSSIRDMSASLQEADAHTWASQDRIQVLEETVCQEEANLSSAHRALSDAKDQLDRKRTAQNIVRTVAIVSFFFAPVVSLALGVIDATTLERAVDDCKERIDTIESQLASSRSQLQCQRDSLSQAHRDSAHLSAIISDMKQRVAQLSAEKQRLEYTRSDLAELSTRINDCLYTVNAALSSSKSISTMSSMRNVVAGVRGVISALGANAMFEGPLSQLDDAAFGALDRRIAAIRRRQLAV